MNAESLAHPDSDERLHIRHEWLPTSNRRSRFRPSFESSRGCAGGARREISAAGDRIDIVNWLNAYAQDDWRPQQSHAELRSAIRTEPARVRRDNRLSSVDLSVPGGRFVVASDARGNLDPSAASLLPVMPLPVVSSADAGGRTIEACPAKSSRS
jgi:hypothetical protein